MLKLSERLAQSIREGKSQIGQIAIFSDHGSHEYVLCHVDDREKVSESDYTNLTKYTDPEDAHGISTYDDEGAFRFTKGELSLKSGWIYFLNSKEDLTHTLTGFYGAAVALWFAQEDKTLRVQNLRDKLSRQTGMYRYAGSISDPGAQQLIRDYCGPANKCVKKILWNISDEEHLEPSEATTFNGMIGEEQKCIPMLCQEACNFLVSKARTVAKKEFEAK